MSIMRRWLLFTLYLATAPSVHALSLRCGAAQDFTVQALERVGPDSPLETVRDANELLKRSEQMCSELGDTWYFRSLFETRLGNAPGAKFSLAQATKLKSEALSEKLNPFILAAPKSSEPRTDLPPGTGWALVIGISHFADANIDPLKYTAEDAKLFASTLQQPTGGSFAADHVRTLLDDDATTPNIRAGLNWIARNAKPEDLVVIFVATHGSARELDSVAGANYLITQDTKIGPQNDQDLLFGSALPMNDLVATVANRISSLRTAIFIDTCYSGSAQAGARGESVSNRDLKRFGQGQGRIIMTAASANQESRESDDFHHGYFTYFLVQALRSQKSPPLLSDVYQQVSRNVSARVFKDTSPLSEHQDPVLSRSSDGTDFALAAQP